MLFSSMPPDQIPAPGDAVRIGYNAREYQVVKRYRVNSTGQVYLGLDDGTDHAVELIHWAPRPGDTVQLIHKATIEWYEAMEVYAAFAIEFGDWRWKAKRDLIRDWQIEASTPGSWFFIPHTLDSITDGFATLDGREYPIQCVTCVKHGGK